MFQNNSMRALEAYFGNQTGAPVTVTAPVAAPVAVPAPVVTPVSIPAPVVVEAPVATPVVEPVAAPVVEIETPKAEAPVAAAAPVSTNLNMYEILTEAIADKTGYPTDMIDEDMELEADLGIDSIKRVEILSMVNTALGSVFTKENVEELSGLGKIADIVDYLKNLAPAAAVAEEAPVTAVEVPVAEAPVVEAPAAEAAPVVSGGKITEVILAAIADKTGYPEDMIDNDMELEADLGIDSIKRVEIFADVIKQLNITLTPDQTEELSGLSTVEAIDAYLSTLV
jgi:acyl carrier protein